MNSGPIEEQPGTFRAFRIHSDEKGYRSGVEELSLEELTAGEVLIRVEWSGLNYKDALAVTGKGKILREFPLNAGIDLAGTVLESESENRIYCHSFNISYLGHYSRKRPQVIAMNKALKVNARNKTLEVNTPNRPYK